MDLFLLVWLVVYNCYLYLLPPFFEPFTILINLECAFFDFFVITNLFHNVYDDNAITQRFPHLGFTPGYAGDGTAEGVWSSSGQWCATRGKKGTIVNPRVLLIGKAYSSDPEGDGPKRKRKGMARQLGWRGLSPGKNLTRLFNYINISTFEINNTPLRISQRAYSRHGGWTMKYIIKGTKHQPEQRIDCDLLDETLNFTTREQAEDTTNIIRAIRAVKKKNAEEKHTQTSGGSSSSSSSHNSGGQPKSKKTNKDGTVDQRYKNGGTTFGFKARHNYNYRMQFKKDNYHFADTVAYYPELYKEWFDTLTDNSKKKVKSTRFHSEKKKIMNHINRLRKRVVRDKLNYDIHINLKKTIAAKAYKDLILPINNKSFKVTTSSADMKHFKSRITESDILDVSEKAKALCALAKELSITELNGDISYKSDQYTSMEHVCAKVGHFHNRHGRTIAKWWKEFTKTNKQRFSESLRGKYLRTTIFDENAVMKQDAIEWLRDRIMRRNTQANPNPVFRMQDWLQYLNEDGGLLDTWHVPPDALHRIKLFQEAGYNERKNYLTVSYQTARRWAKNLGVNFEDVHKSYYVDGHDDLDVIDYRQYEVRCDH